MQNPGGRFSIIRNALNCTQEQIANYLGVTRFHLNNVENRRRQLPDEAEILMNRLLSIILNTHPQTEVQDPGATPEVSTYAMGLYTHLQRLEKQLQEVQAARKQALEATQYVAAVRAAANVDGKLDQFLAVLEASLHSQLYKHSAKSIAMLQAKIKATKAAWIAISDDTAHDA